MLPILVFSFVAITLSGVSTAQPPLVCPNGTIPIGTVPIPIPRVHAFRSAIRPNFYTPHFFDNIWNETYPLAFSGDEAELMYGLNGYIRKDENIVVTFSNMPAGQEIKLIPMIPPCDGYSEFSLTLQLFVKSVNSSEWVLIQTAVNEPGEIEREVFGLDGVGPYWLPQGYPVSCLSFCPFEPTDEIIKYSTFEDNEEVKVVATLTHVSSGGNRDGDVFILKGLTNFFAHMCQSPDAVECIRQLGAGLTNGKALHHPSCDALYE